MAKIAWKTEEDIEKEKNQQKLILTQEERIQALEQALLEVL